MTVFASVAVAGLATVLVAPAAMAEPGYLEASTTDVYEGGAVTFTTNYEFGADFVDGVYQSGGLWRGGFTVEWGDFMDCASPTILTTWTAYATEPTPPPTIEGADAAVNVTFHACMRNQTPAPVLQQVEMPASGSCAVVDDAALNWGGAASGGWSASWADWARGGKGGAVCTRTLTYSNALGHWVSG